MALGLFPSLATVRVRKLVPQPSASGLWAWGASINNLLNIMKKILYVLVGGLIALTGFAAYIVQANPSFFVYGQNTAVATSTVVYMTPGTATTTLIQPTVTNGNPTVMNTATFLVQFTGSSTASNINIEFEYATAFSGTNCQTTPASCDWYKDGLYGANGVISTTTTPVGLGTRNVYNLPFSTTPLAGQSGTATRTNKILNVQTPAQYVRAVITMPAGSANGAIWAEWLPLKQQY